MSVVFAACVTPFDPRDLQSDDAAASPMDASGVGDAQNVTVDSQIADVGCVSCPSGTSCCRGSCFDLHTDPLNCSACGAACPGAANAVAVCANGSCGTRCAAGFDDCDGRASNGCETAPATSVMNCGRCGNACMAANAMTICSSGTCAIGTCAHGYFDCNGDVADGCETHCTTGHACCP